MSRTSNPALRDSVFQSAEPGMESMTLAGTVNKTAMLLAVLVASSAITWWSFAPNPAANQYVIWLVSASLLGFVVALVTIFKPRYAGITAPLYAIIEGAVIGGISLLFEQRFPGIVLQAVGLTFATFACMLAAYKSGLIKVTHNFRLGVVSATGAVVLIYIIDIVLQMFGLPIGFIHDSGWIGIGFSLIVVSIAALNLTLDFDFIETGVERGAPKYMEWYGAFGLIVTLVWLYLEMLRLLSKTRR